ncbi:MAG: M43 family zinc metalloprotease [Planctomycetota bacterium]|nr:M43 family zinc metalloprotease [Planctomycetota bacterium]
MSCITRLVVAASVLFPVLAADAQSPEKPWQHADGRVEFQGRFFPDWDAYRASDFFDWSKQCATPSPADPGEVQGDLRMGASDCPLTETIENPANDPDGTLYRIPVVVHVLYFQDQGVLSDEEIQISIDNANDFFRANFGSVAQAGFDVGIEFYLAEVDPQGNPTTGITRTENLSWYNNTGNYSESLSWDPMRYVNVYTNTAYGALGYVSGFPAQPGFAGSIRDYVVMNPECMRGVPCAGSIDTLAHEFGHYLGLFHTFQTPRDGCVSGPAGSCLTNGDLICDTCPTTDAWFDCNTVEVAQCGSLPYPYNNVMSYTHECKDRFTPGQANRMRCSLLTYRPLLYTTAQTCVSQCFADIDNNGIIEGADLSYILGYWGPCSGGKKGEPCCADLDGNGLVDSGDLGLLLGSWGSCEPYPVCENFLSDLEGDECQTAIVAIEGVNQIDTTLMTPTIVSVADACDFLDSDFTRDGWFIFEVQAVGSMSLDFCDSDYDTSVVVYKGECESLLGITCDADGCDSKLGYQSRIDGIEVSPGTYYIRVGGRAGAAGNAVFDLSFEAVPVLEGDECESAFVAVEGNNEVNTSLMYSSADPPENGDCQYLDWYDSRDAWFVYEASSPGQLNLVFCLSDYDTSVVVYRGACGSLVRVACDDDSCQPDGPLYTSQILHLPIDAATYYIRVGGWRGDSGTATFNLDFEE